VSAPACSVQAERKALPISAVRTTGLETAASLLGGVDKLADVLCITPRAVRHKITADRGISDGDLLATAAALETRAKRIVDHAFKMREAARPRPAGSEKL